MKIVLPGGSGQVGTILARAFHARGHQVVVLTRKLPAIPTPWRQTIWDARTLGCWQREFDDADVVINLAGRSVNCRYTQANLQEMMRSRVDSTTVIGRAIFQAVNPPPLWLQASTATIYSHRFDADNDDVTGVLGGNEPDAPAYWKFSIDIGKNWESAAAQTCPPSTRLVLMRSAMVMSPDRGGIFDVLLTLVRRGLGGASGSGKQFVSWIHDADFLAAVDLLIARQDLAGPVNLASPAPLPNADFMRSLRQAWGTRVGLPASEWMLKIGAVMMRTDTELVLKSRRVVPTRLLNAGFKFQYPTWPSAAEELCRRIRASRREYPLGRR